MEFLANMVTIFFSARVKVERLPLIHPSTLREQMTKRFSHFGEALDLGFHMDGAVFFGQGYVVLDLNNPHKTKPEQLSRVVDWPEFDRELLLMWDEMPQFCRFCQKSYHCRADCMELINTRRCYNCNERGHISRDCPRRNHGSGRPPNKRIGITKDKASRSGSNLSNEQLAQSVKPKQSVYRSSYLNSN